MWDDGQKCVAVGFGQLQRLLLPVFVVSLWACLDDAECVNPNVSKAQLSRHADCIIAYCRKLVRGHLLTVFVQGFLCGLVPVR